MAKRVIKNRRIQEGDTPRAAPSAWSGAPSSPRLPLDLLARGKVHGEARANKKCEPPKKKEKYVDAAGNKKSRYVPGPMRDCHVELSFIGARRAKREGVESGIYLRACQRPKEEGVLVRVRDHADAKAKTEEICACRASGKSTKACAAPLASRRRRIVAKRGRK